MRWQALPATLDNPGRGAAIRSAADVGRARRAASARPPLLVRRRVSIAIRTAACWSARATPPRGRSRAASRPRRLTDRLWSLRLDTGGAANRFMARYAGEWATDTAASARRARHRFSDRSGRTATNRYNSVLASWTSAPRGNFVNSLNGSVSTFLNETLPVTTAPQLTFPSIQDGASFRMPQETRQTRLQITDSATLVRGAHSLRFGGEVQRVDARIQARRLPAGPHRVRRGLRHVRSQRRRRDRRQRPAVRRHAAQRQARSGADPARRRQHAHRRLHSGRLGVSNRLQLNLGLRYEIDSEVNNQSRVDELNPIVLPFVTDERQRDLNNFGPRVGFAWNADRSRSRRSRRLRPLLRPHRAADPVARARARRPRAAHRGACRQRVLPRSGDRTVSALRSDARRIRSPASSCRAPAHRASTSSTRTCRTRSVHEFHLGVEQDIAGLRARADVHAQPGHPLPDRPHRRRGLQPRRRRTRSRREHRVERARRSTTRCCSRSIVRSASGYGFRVGYTLAKAFNYANDDQIPFLNGPIDPNDLAERMRADAERSSPSARR